MRQPSPNLSHYDVKLLAAAMRQSLMHKRSRQKSVSEGALQPQRQLMSALAAAATPFTSSEIKLMVQLRLKLCSDFTLQPISPPIVS